MIYESGGGCPKKILPFPSLTAGGSHKFSPVGPFPPSLARGASNKDSKSSVSPTSSSSAVGWYGMGGEELERGVMKHSAVS